MIDHRPSLAFDSLLSWPASRSSYFSGSLARFPVVSLEGLLSSVYFTGSGFSSTGGAADYEFYPWADVYSLVFVSFWLDCC